MSPAVIKIKPTSGGTPFEVTVDSLEVTIEAFKELVSTACEAPASRLRLIYKGQILKDPQTLESYGLSDGHVVHMVKSKPPPASGSSPAAAATPAGATSTPSATSQPANTSALFDAAGLPGLGNISEEQIQGMMNNPMMQSILNNPQLLRQMLESNPLFQRMARDHPEMQAMLDDPSALSNMMRSMADPQMRQLQLRGLDNAMAHLNTIPGAFSQLSSISSAINRSMDAAADEAAEEADQARRRAIQSSSASTQRNEPEGDRTEASNPFTGLFQGGSPNNQESAPNVSPLPNPWSNTGSGGGRGQGAGAIPDAGLGDQDPFAQLLSGMGGAGGLGSAGAGLPPGRLSSMMQDPEVMRRMFSMMAKPGAIEAMQRFNSALVDLQRQQGNNQNDPLLTAMLMGGLGGGTPAGSGATGETGDAMQRMQSAMADLQRLGLMETMLGMDSGPGSAATGGNAGPAGGTTDFNSVGGLLGALSGLGEAPSSAAPPADPEAEYASQLQQLREMGFYDQEANIRALVATRGNVHAAVERLLMSG